MSTARFYLPPEEWGANVRIEGQEARHISQVLRLVAGDSVEILDGRGRTGHFVITGSSKKSVSLECTGSTEVMPPVSRAVLALALSKATRRGFFMEKAVELGADSIWLWQADFSQGKLAENMLGACQRQMIAGAKQCGNPWLPTVRILRHGVDELVACAAEADYRILPWELQSDTKMLTPQIAGRPGLTVYVIGPEGGFSARELAAFDAAYFIRVSLGGRILRCETAATLCLGIHWWASQLPDHARPARVDLCQ